VLLVILVVPVDEFIMPLNVQLAVVEPSEFPTLMQFAVVVLPTTLPVIVKFPLAPAVLIPDIVKPMATAPVVEIEPIVLFWMETDPVDVTEIPVNNPPEVEEVTLIAPVPIIAPIVLAVVVPIFTLPARTEMPVKMPAPVLVALVVVKLIPLIVLPWISELAEIAVVISIPMNLLAKVPS